MYNKANCRLAWNSVADGKAITATSYAGNMLPDNLINTQIQSKWRSTTLTEQTLSGDLGELLPVGYFCFYAHNLSPTSMIRFVLSINADYSNPSIDEIFNGLEPTYGLGEILGLYLGGFSLDNFFTKYTVKWFSQSFGQYWKVVITDTDNTDGYIEAGRLKFGEYFEGVYNMSWGYTSDIKTNSKIVLSESLARYVKKKPQQRSFALDFNYLDGIEEQTVVRMISEIDLEKDILFSAYPDTGTSEEQLHTALCFIDSWKPRSRVSVPFRTWGLNLVESV